MAHTYRSDFENRVFTCLFLLNFGRVSFWWLPVVRMLTSRDDCARTLEAHVRRRPASEVSTRPTMKIHVRDSRGSPSSASSCTASVGHIDAAGRVYRTRTACCRAFGSVCTHVLACSRGRARGNELFVEVRQLATARRLRRHRPPRRHTPPLLLLLLSIALGFMLR